MNGHSVSHKILVHNHNSKDIHVRMRRYNYSDVQLYNEKYYSKNCTHNESVKYSKKAVNVNDTRPV